MKSGITHTAPAAQRMPAAARAPDRRDAGSSVADPSVRSTWADQWHGSPRSIAQRQLIDAVFGQAGRAGRAGGSPHRMTSSAPVQRLKGLDIGETVFVHTTLGPKQGLVVALLDGGEAYRVKLTSHHDQVYEVSHFIVDTSPDRLPSDDRQAKEVGKDVQYERSIRTRILEELDLLIAAKRKKIDLFELVKTKDESHRFSESDIETMNAEEAEVTGPVVAMMLEAEARRRATDETGFDPFLIAGGANFQRFLKELSSLPATALQRRTPLNFLLLEDGHYTPIHIRVGKDRLHIFSVEASGTPKNYGKLTALSEEPFKMDSVSRIYSDGDVQMDGFSCESFSLQDLDTMSRMSLEDLCASIPAVHMPQWQEEDNDYEYFQDIGTLGPEFLKNVQSGSSLRTYMDQRGPSKQDDTEVGDQLPEPGLGKLLDHYQRHLRIYPKMSKAKDGSHTVERKNRAIDYRRYEYLCAARSIVASEPLQEIEHILDRRLFNCRDLGVM